ncbi:MAG: bifunctional riboflavin kinase/FAD synthetase [Planctomycetes bacterium]|nr:bifunctional riboflavin kinase/FAD synthetase [Planctomycetota bacterium]
MFRFFNPCDNIFSGKRPVVTIGMFDGVHKGHQKVINETTAMAGELGQPSLAITFDVHPRAVLPSHDAPEMITTLEHRLVLFERLGLDATLIMPFNDKLAKMRADDFINQILAGCLKASGVVLGSDARFGCDRAGNARYLESVGEKYGFRAREVMLLEKDGTKISSSAIRKAVTEGDLDRAEEMLSRKVSVLGTIISGQGLGRKLGFPTLNLDPHHELHPPKGVYITKARCGQTTWNSVTNIGHRPTIDASNPRDVLIETHLFDFNGNLYGQNAEVSFLKRIRSETKFESQEELTKQVMQDIDDARAYFAVNG